MAQRYAPPERFAPHGAWRAGSPTFEITGFLLLVLCVSGQIMLETFAKKRIGFRATSAGSREVKALKFSNYHIAITTKKCHVL